MLRLWFIYVISVLSLLYFHTSLFIDALWSHAGKRLTSWLSMSYCVLVTFLCGDLGQVWYLYRLLIFAVFLTCVYTVVYDTYFPLTTYLWPYDVTVSRSYCRCRYPFISSDKVMFLSKLAINTRFLFSLNVLLF